LGIVGGHAIDDRQAGLDRSAMAGIDASLDRGGEDHAPTFLQADESIAPGRMIGREARARDRDQASAVGKPGERRRNMAECGVRYSAVDMRRDRERRIHQHHARPQRAIEMVVDVRGVVLRDGETGKELSQQPGTDVRQLVQGQRRAGELGEDGEQAGASRWLEHDIRWRDRGRGDGDEGQVDGRGELLQRLAFPRTARMRRQKSCDLAQHLQLAHG